MASFKIGCIKGAKGEKGADGANGERGDVGAKGERGDAGAVPVLEIDTVETVSPGMAATVEIDSSNPENPKLSFRIPKGADGKDAMGDMLTAVYDAEGKKTDVFHFANSLFENALSKNGGNVSGKISVSNSALSDVCVRNISFSYALPEKAAEGDICFVIAEDYNNTIYSNGVGSVLLIPEGDEKSEYIVAAKDFHGEGSVTLIRKHLPEFTVSYNRSITEDYILSDVDKMLESIYAQLFPCYIQRIMKAPVVSRRQKRHCFLPSVKELQEMEYFKNNSMGTTTESGINREYMTRDLNDRSGVNAINVAGKIVSVTQTTESAIRPMIVIDGKLIVRNCVHEQNAVTEAVTASGAYYYAEGAWKELMY